MKALTILISLFSSLVYASNLNGLYESSCHKVSGFYTKKFIEITNKAVKSKNIVYKTNKCLKRRSVISTIVSFRNETNKIFNTVNLSEDINILETNSKNDSFTNYTIVKTHSILYIWSHTSKQRGEYVTDIETIMSEVRFLRSSNEPSFMKVR